MTYFPKAVLETVDDVFHDLAASLHQGNRSVVGSLALVPFLEKCRDNSSLPIFWNLTLVSSVTGVLSRKRRAMDNSTYLLISSGEGEMILNRIQVARTTRGPMVL